MTDYYVNPCAPNDTGTGAIGCPFQQINTHINDLQGGDRLLLRGDSASYFLYNETEIAITASGNSFYSPITITPYGDENAEIRTPAGDYIFDIQKPYIHILGKDQLVLNKNYVSGAGAIDLDATACNCIIQDLVAKNVKFSGRIIRVHGSYNLIKGCEIYDVFTGASSDAHGIGIDDGTKNVIDDCTIYHCHGDCIIVEDAHAANGTRIRNCTLYTEQGEASENAIDAKLNSSCVMYIENNTLYGFRACTSSSGGSGDTNGEALSVHNQCDNVVIRFNTIYDCAAGINLDDGVDNILVQRNTIRELVDSTTDPNAQKASMAAFGIRAACAIFLNNIVEDCPENSLWIHNSTCSCLLRNNIFDNCGSINDAGWSPSADHNCWYNCVESISGTGDISTNPTFTDKDGHDYTLQASSSCIDVGADHSLMDYYLGASADMGANEYSDGTERVQVTIWVSDGTGDGAVGDLMAKASVDTIHATDTIADFSAM
jgi:hypothetical protein